MLLIPVATDRPINGKTPVTYAIMGICTVVLAIELIQSKEWITNLCYIPGYGSFIHLFTSMFMHAGVGHLLGNMLFLYVVGLKTEDTLGWLRYVMLYLAGGIAATAVHVFFSFSRPIPSLGASGAIAAIMGAFMVLYPYSKIKMLYALFLMRVGTFAVPAVAALALWFGIEVYSLYSGSEVGVAFGAHVGGFAAGAIWIWGFYGWNQGERLEECEMTVRSLFGRDEDAPSDEGAVLGSLYRTFRKSIAALGVVAAIAYAGFVGATGSFSNPDRPRTQKEIRVALSAHEAELQDVKQVLQKASTGGMFGAANHGAGSFAGRISAPIREHERNQREKGLEERIALHQVLAQRWREAPKDTVFCFGAPLQAALAGPLAKYRFQVVGLEEKTVLFKGDTYAEVLSATSIPLPEVFQSWLETLHRRKALIETATLEADKAFIRATLGKEKRTLTVLFKRAPVFSEHAIVCFMLLLADGERPIPALDGKHSEWDEDDPNFDVDFGKGMDEDE